MYKTILVAIIALTTSIAFGQEKVEKKLNKETNLVEATYYHENGTISQEGTFNLKGKLHGEWVSYNQEGEKIAVGSYQNGAKTGTWYFWQDNILKEVEFSNNQIANVVETNSSTGIVNH